MNLTLAVLMFLGQSGETITVNTFESHEQRFYESINLNGFADSAQGLIGSASHYIEPTPLDAPSNWGNQCLRIEGTAYLILIPPSPPWKLSSIGVSVGRVGDGDSPVLTCYSDNADTKPAFSETLATEDYDTFTHRVATGRFGGYCTLTGNDGHLFDLITIGVEQDSSQSIDPIRSKRRSPEPKGS